MLTSLHGTLANAMFMFLLLAALWSLVAFVLNRPVSPSLIATLVLAEGLIVVQGLLGMILWVTGRAPEGGLIHILYGIVAIISLPAAAMYTRDRPNRYRLGVITIICLWLVGISIRGMATGA